MRRLLLVLVMLLLLGACAFGFLATFEPMDERTRLVYRLVYGGIGVAVIVVLVTLARRRKRA